MSAGGEGLRYFISKNDPDPAGSPVLFYGLVAKEAATSWGEATPSLLVPEPDRMCESMAKGSATSVRVRNRSFGTEEMARC